MSFPEPLTALKKELLENMVPQILDLLEAALRDGWPLHQVEGGLWDLAWQLGYKSLGAFLASHGSGDLGETLTLADGRRVERLKQLHPRRYVSIFGAFQLQRTVYGLLRGDFNARVRGFCKELYAYRERLWVFVEVEGVEPTNNAAERSLRHAVIWRKLLFGTQSAAAVDSSNAC